MRAAFTIASQISDTKRLLYCFLYAGEILTQRALWSCGKCYPNYKCYDQIGTPKFLPLDQECCRFSPDPLPRVAIWVWGLCMRLAFDIQVVLAHIAMRMHELNPCTRTDERAVSMKKVSGNCVALITLGIIEREEAFIWHDTNKIIMVRLIY